MASEVSKYKLGDRVLYKPNKTWFYVTGTILTHFMGEPQLHVVLVKSKEEVDKIRDYGISPIEDLFNNELRYVYKENDLELENNVNKILFKQDK